MKRLKIAYVSIYDSRDIHKWSGLGYYIAKTFEKHVGEIEYIGNLKTKRFLEYEAKRIINKIFFKKRYLTDITPKVVEGYAREIQKRMNGKKYDLIVCPSTRAITELKTEIPIITWTDSCFPGLLDFYEPINKISAESLKNGFEIEKRTLQNVTLLIYASDWAASIAKDCHGIDPSKVKVVPFGANVEHKNSLHDILGFIEKKTYNICKLLFIGVDWKRKGGNIAFETAKELNERGLKTELAIVGCEPEIKRPLPDFVKSLGFISKSTEDGRNRINKLFEESHFLIVPSEAEAYGLVFCEANSFGVPAISRKLGGITTIIKDNVNGVTFERNDSTNKYVNFIYNLMNDYNKYKELCLSSFNEFKNRLNWDIAGQKVNCLIKEITNKKGD